MKLSCHPRGSSDNVILSANVTEPTKIRIDRTYKELQALLPFPQQKDDEAIDGLLARYCILSSPARMLKKLLKYLCHRFSVSKDYIQTEFLEEYQGDRHDVGYFQPTSSLGGIIAVKKIKKGDGYMYASVLIHEFMHFLMHNYQLDLSSFNREETELLTDAMTVFSGFGKIMIAGYYPREDSGHKNLYGYGDDSIGYLSIDEIGYIERQYVLTLNARIH